MNRLLLDPAEVGPDGTAELHDARAAHMLRILRVTPGERIRAGILEGPLGEAEILSMAPADHRVRLRFEAAGAPPPRPPVSLMLALPRPKVLKRLWAPLAAAGVDRVFIVNSEKVERMYFDSDALDPVLIRARLIEGLAQAGDTRLPEVAVRRRLKPFIEDELGAAPVAGAVRLAAHPDPSAPRVSAVVRPGARILAAVGPEGGWTPYELDLLARHGFARVSMGGRILRSDHAAVALLALAHDALREMPDAANAEGGTRKAE